MRASSITFSIVAVGLIPLFAQACAQGSVEIIDNGGDGGSGGMKTTGEGGSTPSGSSSSGAPGPCTTGADCASFTDACNTGACINGACGRLPANDGAVCDDGLFCTENTTCKSGICGMGTTKACPGSGPCMVGSCDIATDTCISIPGNNGTPCVDNDPCTVTSTCSNGNCIAGQKQDCSFLNGACGLGVCDPQLGCVVQAVNDGTPCNDGFFCTVNDVCKAGICGGVQNTCAPPNNTCMTGVCNEAMKACVTVAGNDGTACDDGNLCTSNTTCLSGQCVGGQAANEGMACDDANGCTLGTTCTNGTCGNPNAQVMQCVSGDACCPMGCASPADGDCINLADVFAQYPSDTRNVYIWKSPKCAVLANYTNFCQSRGLSWWSPKSQADAQQLITFAYNLDNWHTWIQTYESTSTDVNGQVGGFPVIVDGVGCVEGSNTGWTAFRKWACSFCDPESNAQQMDNGESCCWDKDHEYDWFVCED